MPSKQESEVCHTCTLLNLSSLQACNTGTEARFPPMDQPPSWPIGARCNLLGCEISIGVCEDPAPAANSFYTSLVSTLNTSSCRGCFFSHFQVSSFTRALFTSLLVGRPPPSPLESSTFTWWGEEQGRISLWVAAIRAISRSLPQGTRPPHNAIFKPFFNPLFFNIQRSRGEYRNLRTDL